MYYEEGNTRKSISPDVFVVFGVEKKLRRTYRTWDESNTPDFVLEVASPSTFKEDMGRKKDLYATVLGVKEYYIYDPLGQIVPSFIGFRLIDGVYQEIEFVNNRLSSEVLGLELGEHEGVLRLYNPNTEQWLQTLTEEVKIVRERAENAEAELAEALAEIERLRTERNG
jgi:Uma2 family endonuclease